MATVDELVGDLRPMFVELDLRAKTHRTQEAYYTGRCPLPQAVVSARVTKAYRMLMPMAEAPWGSLVVDSVTDRLEVAGVRSPKVDGQPQDEVDAAVWGVWQDNSMDAESKLIHSTALTSGRAFALVQPLPDESPEITLDSSEQAIVRYREGSRRHREAALRRWMGDDERCYATLYRPDGIWKFQRADRQIEGDSRFKVGDEWWEPRGGSLADFQLPNPLRLVPMVEFAVNRRLAPGSFGYARGEYQHCTALIDRINLLTFLGLVVAFWMGFPLRAILGQQIHWDLLVDDAGNPLIDASTGEQKRRARPPFTSMADEVAQFESPDTRLATFEAADRKNLSVLEELAQLAMITKTPRHYFPMPGGFSNLSADSIRADEGGLNAKVVAHKASLGEGHEELLRVCGRAMPDPVNLSRRAQLVWIDHEARSMAERADAAVKLKDLVPRTVLWERYLNASQDDVARWEALAGSDTLGMLLRAAAQPVAVLPEPVPVGA